MNELLLLLVPRAQPAVEREVRFLKVVGFLPRRREPVLEFARLDELVLEHAVEETEVDCFRSLAAFFPLFPDCDAGFVSGISEYFDSRRKAGPYASWSTAKFRGGIESGLEVLVGRSALDGVEES